MGDICTRIAVGRWDSAGPTGGGMLVAAVAYFEKRACQSQRPDAKVEGPAEPCNKVGRKRECIGRAQRAEVPATN